ncbi:MAG: T9SS type A sorting domain-containing protein [Bacteroidetes bacterium]|nr:T9SS type A sorting domain-containing protein [Bacteroidota bacterium]
MKKDVTKNLFTPAIHFSFKTVWLFAVLFFLSTAKLIAQDGASLDFAGDGDRADIGDFQLTTAFTIELWVQIYAKEDFQTIIGNKFGGLENPGYTFSVNGYQNEDRKLHLETQNFEAVTDEAVIEYGGWQHIAVTTDGNTAIFYLDGQVLPASQNSVSLASSPYSTSIGDFYHYIIGNGSFNGRMDELRIWNYQRSQTEIQEQMICELEGTEEGLMAYYRFNQGIGEGDNSSLTTLEATVGPDGTFAEFDFSGDIGNFVSDFGVSTGVACEVTSAVTEKEAEQLSLGTLTPNPIQTGNKVQATILSEQDEEIQIGIYNTAGQLLHQQSEFLFAGESTIEINSDLLPAGLCWVRFQQGEKVANRKLIIVR